MSNLELRRALDVLIEECGLPGLLRGVAARCSQRAEAAEDQSDQIWEGAIPPLDHLADTVERRWDAWEKAHGPESTGHP